MTRDIEIEIPDQSDVVPSDILKGKKKNVQSLINELPPCSPNYVPLSVSLRPPKPHEELRSKRQTPYSLFQLFFPSFLLQIIANHTNIKAGLERVEVSKHQRPWHEVTGAEIGAFIGVLLYMGIAAMPRTPDYWNVDSKRAIHGLIINSLSRVRWEQIKRYLKISNPHEDEKIDTHGPHWWKKLEPLITEFRKASKKWWIPGSHVSVDEQLIGFRGRCIHIMQLACKAAGVGFKIYSICEENFLIDFLVTSKKVKISELMTATKLGFSPTKWNLTPSSLVVIQLCKSLPNHLNFVLFVDNFFTNARLFKALKTLNIGACGTAKVKSGFPRELVQIRAAATKQKDWGKQGLMTIKSDKKMNIDEGDILCMTWVDMNTVQYMTTAHTIEEMKAVTYKDAKRRHGVPKSSSRQIDDVLKLPFPKAIVEYNSYMGGSDGNAQQRAYYSLHRPDSRYWWPLFIFLIDASVLNAFKLWRLLYPDSKLTHSEFQYQISEALLIDGATRKHEPEPLVAENLAKNPSACEWEHLLKRAYCGPCSDEAARLKKRRPMMEISPNSIKRKRVSQTRWQCSSCGPCCRKNSCWQKLHGS